jgi:hypothetical protein
MKKFREKSRGDAEALREVDRRREIANGNEVDIGKEFYERPKSKFEQQPSWDVSCRGRRDAARKQASCRSKRINRVYLMNGVSVGAKRRRPTKSSSCQVRAQARRLSPSSISKRFLRKIW